MKAWPGYDTLDRQKYVPQLSLLYWLNYDWISECGSRKIHIIFRKLVYRRQLIDITKIFGLFCVCLVRLSNLYAILDF